jgi:hypothetical protein
MEETIPPVTPIDYTNSLNAIITNQNTIIEQNKELVKIGEDAKFLRDYFEITPEEQEQLNQDKLVQDKKENDLFKTRYEQYLKDMGKVGTDSNIEIKEQLKQLNTTNSDTLDVSATTSSTSYMLLFGLVVTVLCYGIYRCFIKPFMY